MDCLFNWPRRPNAVLMGTKQVGTQRSYFGDPRGQTCRGLTLTFWSAFSASALALLSDTDRMLFVDRYYHSAKFSQSREHHEKQVELLLEELEDHFESREVCIQMMYALMTQLYDSAVRVVEGQMADTPETEELSFSIFWGLLSSQIKNMDE